MPRWDAESVKTELLFCLSLLYNTHAMYLTCLTIIIVQNG